MAFCVCLISTPEGDKAAALARMLVEARHAACVNIVPAVQSIYWWEGQISHSAECLLIAKTDKLKVNGLIKAVKLAHPYTVPEVITLRIKEGNRDYLRWIAESVGTSFKKQRIPKGKKKSKETV